MGIDMEIDLSAGLMKAKPAKAALPGGDLPAEDGTNATLPGALDFSALLPLSTDTPDTEPAIEPTLSIASVMLPIPADPQAIPDQPIEVTPDTPPLPGAETTLTPATIPVVTAADPAIAATAIATAIPAAIPAQAALPLTATKGSAPASIDAVQAAIAGSASNTASNTALKTGTPESAIATSISAGLAPPEPGKKATKTARFDQAIAALSPDTPQKPADSGKDTPAPKPLDPATKPVAADQPAPLAARARAAEPVAAPPSAPGPNITATAVSAPALPMPGVSELALTADDAAADLAVAIKIDRQVADIQQLAPQSLRTTPAVATQITSQIQAQISQSSKQVIELRLDPAELGRVTIQLSPQDQSITAQITAERPETLDLMRRHSEVLLATLATAGFSQADLSFQQGTPQQGGRDAPRFQSLGFIAEPTTPTLSAPQLPTADGRLDIRL